MKIEVLGISENLWSYNVETQELCICTEERENIMLKVIVLNEKNANAKAVWNCLW